MQGYQNLKSIYLSERVNVYRAIREIDGKSVILKTQTSEYPSIRDLTRIKYEFDLSQKFPISGMVPILALEKNGNGYTLVMEDVDGIPLLEYWNSSQRSIPIFLNLAIQLTDTLSDLHKYGIIHKDLKPSNILVQRETGKVFLIIQFIPGERESKGIFKIPERLYGREAEVSFLLDAFDRICESPEKIPEEGETEKYGGVKLVLVGGYSGVGKTALIQEVHKPILEKRGYFLSGKFDQFKRNIPYVSLIQAFTSLVRQILTEKEEKIFGWKEKILKICSVNTVLLIELIPELIHITGKLDAIEELNPQQSEERFRKTLLRFVSIFANIHHPLTIFLDDLQWADLPTLKFIETLTHSEEIHHLLLIGAYRDNEVNTLHPLSIMIENLEKDTIQILKISLAPLMEFFIERMVCETLHKEIGNELPEVIHKKTGGNPFFVRHFLKTLYQDKCIYYSNTSGWEYNLEQIHSTKYTENVVEMVSNRLKVLSIETQEILKVASCIGASFSLNILSLAIEKNSSQTARLLRESLMEGVVQPENTSYRSAETLNDDEHLTHLEHVSYKFFHDRVQQASNSLLSDEEKNFYHVKIGTILLNSFSSTQLEESIFEVVNHLNYILKLNTYDFDLSKLIDLNYRAGKKASLSNAIQPSLNYLQIAYTLLQKNISTLSILSEDSIFNIEYELGISLYLNGKFPESETIFQSILSKTNDKDRIFKIQNMRIILYINQGEYEVAIKLGLETLEMYGVFIKTNPSSKFVFSEYLKIKKRVLEKEINEILNLPLIKDQDIINSLQILVNIYSAAYFTELNLSSVIVIKLIELVLDNGNSAYSSFSIVNFASLSSSIGEYNLGYEYGMLSLKLNDLYGTKGMKSKLIQILTGFILHWNIPIQKSLDLHEEGFNQARENGDHLYSAFMAWFLSGNQDALGIHLSNLLELVKRYYSHTINIKYYDVDLVIQIIIQKCKLLLGTTSNLSLEDNTFNEREFLEKCEKSKMKIHIVFFYFTKARISFIFGDYISAVHFAEEARKRDQYVLGMEVFAELQFYQCISISSLVVDTNPEWKDETFQKNLKNLKKWSESCPENFRDKFCLVQAEIYRIKGLDKMAIEYYNYSIESALENQFIQNAAIASEMVGKYYLSLGVKKLFKVYLNDAMYNYNSWGAFAKVRELKERYNLSNISENTYQAVDGKSSQASKKTNQISIDTQSILRATQVIAEEIKLDDLLKKLLIITLENAGAQRGVLLLYENDQLNVEAEGIKENNKVTLFSGISLNNYSNIPQSIIQYSTRTSQAIILDSAVDDTEFGENPYIQREKIHSLLCNPIFSKGKLIGLLYLENNLLRGAFTKERVEILNMIVSQAAISIENARLYDSLEEKVKKRTIELGEQKHRLERIQNFTKMIQNAQDLDSMMENINSTFMNNFGIGSYLFYLCNTKNKKLELIYAISDIPFAVSMKKKLMECPIPFGEENSTHNAVMNYKKAIFFKNARRGTLSKSENEIKNLLDISSLYVIPLINYGEVFAVLSIADTSSEFQDKQNLHKITRTQREDIELLCQSISSGLYQSLQKKELEKKSKFIEELNIFLKKINESNDLERVFHQIHDYTIKNFGIQHISIGVIDSSEKFAIPVIVSYPEDSYNKELLYSIKIPVVDTIGAHAYSFKTNKPLFTKKVKIKGTTPEELKISEICNFNSCLIIPLILNNRNIGFLDFFNLKGFEMNLTKEQINQLSILAEQLAGIIYSSNLYQELQSQKQELESTLSELRTTQAQLVEAEKSAALGQLISGVAHEINNPLAAIRSSAEILEMDQEKFLEEIPFFFQRKAPEFLATFLELQKISDRKKRAQTTKEERQRKKMVFSKLDSYPFSSPNAREEISDLIAELWLEEDFTKLISTFSEENVLQILKYLSLSSVQKNSLKNIKLSTEKSARVIFSLRKYLKTEIRGTPRLINIADLIESSLNVYDNYIRGIVTIEKNYSIQPSITCVVDEVQQVFKNLIFNAIQAMYQSDPKILTIQIDPIEESQYSFFLVSFQDTGKGIDPNAEKHLFTPFYTTKSRGEGIGLGLYVSKAIMEEHGGRLEYEKLVSYTSFTLYFRNQEHTS